MLKTTIVSGHIRWHMPEPPNLTLKLGAQAGNNNC